MLYLLLYSFYSLFSFFPHILFIICSSEQSFSFHNPIIDTFQYFSIFIGCIIQHIFYICSSTVNLIFVDYLAIAFNTFNNFFQTGIFNICVDSFNPYNRKVLVSYHTFEKINIPSLYFGFKLAFFYIDDQFLTGSFSDIPLNLRRDPCSIVGLESILTKIIRHHFSCFTCTAIPSSS